MQLRELTAVLNDIAPTRNAESWDNVGLLVGDPEQPVSRVLLTIDYTEDVAEEAKREGCDAVVAYHPPLFEAIKRVTGEKWVPALEFEDGSTISGSDKIADWAAANPAAA